MASKRRTPGVSSVIVQMIWALRDGRGLTAIQSWHMTILVSHVNANGECFPSVLRLAIEAGTSPSAIRRTLKCVAAGAGPIAVEREGRVFRLSLRPDGPARLGTA